jgi:hypothetical protein
MVVCAMRLIPLAAQARNNPTQSAPDGFIGCFRADDMHRQSSGPKARHAALA